MSSISALNSLLSSASSSDSTTLNISSLLAAATGATSVGIDVTSAVNAALYAAEAPERQWQAQQSTLQSQISTVSSIQTALTAVSNDLQDLNSPDGSLSALTVSSSSSSLVTATASTGAVAGTHVVNVSSLATSDSWYSSALADANASLGSSTLSITLGDGSQTSFSLGSNGIDSLSALAAAINSDSLGLTASVITDATGSRLALVSDSSGSGSNFSVSDGSSTATSWTSASVANSSSTLSASTFQVGDGNSTATINVAAGSTLTDVANAINSQGLNLTASVNASSSGEYLEIDGVGGGSVTVSSDPTLSFTQPSVGTDASLSVDGIPITSASNTVTGAIPGVTVNLQGITAAGDEVTLDIAPDSTQISSALSQFVSDYNSAVSLVNSQFTYDSSTQTEGTLGSDPTVRSLQSTLLSVGGYAASDAGSSSSPITTLGALGITMNNDGSLSLDTSQLDQALQSDPSGVQNFFQGSSLNGFAGSVQSQLDVFSDPAVGALTVDSNNLTQQYNDLQTDVNNFQNGYIASQKTLLTSMYSQAEIALQQLPTTMKQLQAQLGQNSGS